MRRLASSGGRQLGVHLVELAREQQALRRQLLVGRRCRPRRPRACTWVLKFEVPTPGATGGVGADRPARRLADRGDVEAAAVDGGGVELVGEAAGRLALAVGEAGVGDRRDGDGRAHLPARRRRSRRPRPGGRRRSGCRRRARRRCAPARRTRSTYSVSSPSLAVAVVGHDERARVGQRRPRLPRRRPACPRPASAALRSTVRATAMVALSTTRDRALGPVGDVQARAGGRDGDAGGLGAGLGARLVHRGRRCAGCWMRTTLLVLAQDHVGGVVVVADDHRPGLGRLAHVEVDRLGGRRTRRRSPA